LWKEQQKTRYDVGREQFLEEIWKWKNEWVVKRYCMRTCNLCWGLQLSRSVIVKKETSLMNLEHWYFQVLESCLSFFETQIVSCRLSMESTVAMVVMRLQSPITCHAWSECLHVPTNPQSSTGEPQVRSDWCITRFKVLIIFLVCFRKGDKIYEQMRQLGSSLDWTKSCFTMDPVSKP
jgi:hypothetical protein